MQSLVGAGLLVGATLGAGAAPADSEGTRPAVRDEYAVKAAMVYNIAKFTRWPDAAYASASAPLRLCVFGGDPFGAALDSLAGRRAAGRSIAVHRLGESGRADRCHVLFIARTEPDAVARLLDRLAERPVLTIADMPGFDRASGMIALRTVADRVRFRINLGVADKAGLSFSSKLLALADVLHSTDTESPPTPGDGGV